MTDISTTGEQEAAPEAPEQLELFEALGIHHHVPPKDDMTSMELPIFSLKKQPEMKVRSYEKGGRQVTVYPSAFGAATIFDRDILIFCISQVVRGNEAGIAVSRKIQVDVGAYLQATQKSRG